MLYRSFAALVLTLLLAAAAPACTPACPACDQITVCTTCASTATHGWCAYEDGGGVCRAGVAAGPTTSSDCVGAGGWRFVPSRCPGEARD